MKLLTVLLFVLTSQIASAGVFDVIATSGWDKKEPKKYMIETHGFDVRVYEWKLDMSDKTCVLVSTEKTQFVQCR